MCSSTRFPLENLDHSWKLIFCIYGYSWRHETPVEKSVRLRLSTALCKNNFGYRILHFLTFSSNNSYYQASIKKCAVLSFGGYNVCLYIARRTL